jgi:signal transduction histidine kinase
MAFLKSLAATIVATLLAQTLHAECKSPLPTEALRALDGAMDSDPASVDAEVSRRLAGGAGLDELNAAELNIMLAEAAEEMDNLPRTHAAVAAARTHLRALPAGPVRDALELRVALIAADTAATPTDIRAALQDLDQREAALPADSLPHACLLIIRSGVNGRLSRHADAVRDGLRARRVARLVHAPSAAADAAFELADSYLRAHLLEEAADMITESIDYNRAAGAAGALAHSLQIRAWILTEMQRYADALAATAEARAINLRINDPVDVTFADEGRCDILVRMGRTGDAAQPCLAAERAWADFGRKDQLAKTEADLAAIDLAHGAAQAALARLNPILDGDLQQVPLKYQPDLYHVRAAALASQGRYREALADTRAEDALRTEELHERHDLVAAVLQGRAEAEADSPSLAVLAHMPAAGVSLAALSLVSLCGLVWWALRRRMSPARSGDPAQPQTLSVDRLTAGIAHEFNNQLTVIQQGLGLLERRPLATADPTARQLIDELQESSRTSARITAQLQSFSGQQLLQPEDIDLGVFLESSRPALQRAAGPRIELELLTATPPPPVHADARQLTAALVNLVANARDAMRDGGTVTLRAGPDGPQFTIVEVIDRGVGMAPEVLRLATEPFYTTKPVGAGAGLGLSMVDGFVRQSGGSLRLSSAPGQGTTVTLRLPRGAPRS